MFYLFQVTNQQLLHWMDRTRNQTNTFEPIQSNCDRKDNVLKRDSGKIMDVTKLPILGISYGKFSSGMARLKLGPLVCSPG